MRQALLNTITTAVTAANTPRACNSEYIDSGIIGLTIVAMAFIFLATIFITILVSED